MFLLLLKYYMPFDYQKIFQDAGFTIFCQSHRSINFTPPFKYFIPELSGSARIESRESLASGIYERKESYFVEFQASIMHDQFRARLWPCSVAVLIPAYKAAESLSRFLPSLLSAVPPDNICVVDDGSNDSTEEVCREKKIHCLNQPMNYGKGAALVRGFEYLADRFEWIITMDADGQHAVEDLYRFVDTLSEEPDAGLIIGSRAISIAKMPFPRVISNATTSAILTVLTGQRIFDSQCGYRAYNGSFVRNCTVRYSRFEMESEIILRAWQHRQTIIHVPVQTLYCSDRSHIAHVRDTLRWIRAVVDVWQEIVRGRFSHDITGEK